MDEAWQRMLPHWGSDEPLCLTFANTVSWRPSSRRYDWLASYRHLVAWSEHLGLLDAPRAARLLALAAQQPEAASAALVDALALREALYAIFSAEAAGRPASAGDLERLNRALARALAHLRCVRTPEGYTWTWADSAALDQMLWPVARSAAELLTSPTLRRVRECAAEWCGWLFVDRSHAQRRQWCTMAVCGNRAKGRRHYQRHRAAARPAAPG